MSKHTPGPFSLGTPEQDGGGLHVPIHAATHGELAMVVWQMEDDVHDDVPSLECQANAHLFVAAPDLLEALENLLLAYSDPGNSGSTHDDKVAAAHAAIAKARGQL